MSVTETTLQSNIAKYRASFSLEWHKQYRAECQPKQMKLLRDLRKLYKSLGLSRWVTADRMRYSLQHPQIGLSIDNMPFDKNSTWSGIKTNIPLSYNEQQKVAEAMESMGYAYVPAYIEKGTCIPRLGYKIYQSYWTSSKGTRLTMLEFFDLSIRQYFTPTEQFYDTWNPKLSMCEFSIFELPQFDNDGYLKWNTHQQSQ